jgi:hypothetical protein
MNHCPRCGKDNPAEVHTCTPKALLLAELLETDGWPDAANELRRQYEELEGQADRIQSIYGQLNDTEKEVDDLRLLLRQALDCLELYADIGIKGADTTITAIKERLG